MIIASMGGNSFVDAEYAHRASRRRLKSSSGVQDVLLTNSRVSAVIMAPACSAVSSNLSRNARRVILPEIGWKISAGLSWRVKIGERTL